MRDTQNAASLEAIKKAAVVVCLDGGLVDAEPFEVAWPRQVYRGGPNAEHAANRWWDKPVQVVVGEDGGSALLFDHTVCDGTMMAGITNHCYNYAVKAGSFEASEDNAEAVPQKLEFVLGPDTLHDIEKATSFQIRHSDDTDRLFYQFPNYGKNLVQSCNMSPDGYVQMAIQLAACRSYSSEKGCAENYTGLLDALRHFPTDRLEPLGVRATDSRSTSSTQQATRDGNKNPLGERCAERSSFAKGRGYKSRPPQLPARVKISRCVESYDYVNSMEIAENFTDDRPDAELNTQSYVAGSMSDKVCTSTRNRGNMRKAECDSMFRKITAASIRPVEVLLERWVTGTLSNKAKAAGQEKVFAPLTPHK
ncbi:hypothetical protein HPB47_021053, partial [Ixodes persulcatus]